VPSSHGQPLSDSIVELRPIDERDLDMIKRAAQDSEICRRVALLKAKPNEYFMRLWDTTSSTAGGGTQSSSRCFPATSTSAPSVLTPLLPKRPVG
jgi:hypothetical protein